MCHIGTMKSLSPKLGGKEPAQKPSAELTAEPHSCAWPGWVPGVRWELREGWDELSLPGIAAHLALAPCCCPAPSRPHTKPAHQLQYWWVWLVWGHSLGLRFCFPSPPNSLSHIHL